MRGKFATLYINSDPDYLNRKNTTESRKAASSPERVPELCFEWFCPSGGINRQKSPSGSVTGGILGGLSHLLQLAGEFRG